jgi:hypothetical protein
VSLSGQAALSGFRIEKCQKWIWNEFLEDVLPVMPHLNTKTCIKMMNFLYSYILKHFCVLYQVMTGP